MTGVKATALFLAAVLLASCAGTPTTLAVKQFVVRDQESGRGDEPMTAMEKNRHLLGAVSMEERRQRLGQYYTILWHDEAGAGGGPVEVVFQYQQGATASRVKRMSKRFPGSDGSGRAEFAVIGDDFFDNGKVLAWKATVSRGGKELASRHSYLWQ